jgi:hypothetical protein
MRQRREAMPLMLLCQNLMGMKVFVFMLDIIVSGF